MVRMNSPVAARTGLVFCLMAGMGALSAQQEQPGTPAVASFEVASVKPNRSGISNALPPSRANGSYSASNVALKSLIASAYDVRIFQIEGGPAWLTSERFDIIARGREGTPDRLRPAMLRTLLAERFKLVAHFETREQQVYALVLLRGDGRLGPQLKPAAPAGGSSSGFPMTSVDNGTARIKGSRVSMDTFAIMLMGSVFSQRVINRTGLSGEFELDLRFTPESSSAAAPEFPSLFTAVQEQLGLKLQSERGPVPVLVIDSIERPTPD
jgi:uncharacterized protein (TIGR03435 family)